MTKYRSRWLPVLAAALLALPTLAPAPGRAQTGSRTFPETGKTVSGRFLEYWDTHGGLTQQGLPISSQMQERSDTDGKTYTVQYFERAVFEAHPENARPNDVLLSLLGSFLYKQKYPNGAPGQLASFSAGAHLFPETSKHAQGRFLLYWNGHGSLAQQGYPISEEFQEKSDLNGKTYTVQYFERAVFEWHPENQAPYNVLLSQLGTFRYRQKYGSGSGAPTATPQPQAQAKVNVIDFDFDPRTITVSVGTRVVWTNVGPTEHTVADLTMKVFSSNILQRGDTFSYTPTKAGTIPYWCTIHPDMKGTLVVK
jgi:plastocyanin